MISDQKIPKEELLARELLVEIVKVVYASPGAYKNMTDLGKAENRTLAGELSHQAKILAGTFYKH